MRPISLILTTASSDCEADLLCDSLVNERLVACAQRSLAVRSTYWWDDRRESAQETQILLKTMPRLVEATLARIRELHSYTTPELVAWEVQADDHYGRWVEETVSPR